MTRRSRVVRPESRRLNLTARDLDLLYGIGRMGQATSHQLRRLFFGDQITALRRLAKLLSARRVEVSVVAQDGPHVYTLGNAATAALRSAGFSTEQLHRVRPRYAVDLHLQTINDVRVEFVVGARARPDVELVGFLADLDLRRLGGSPPPAYVPDAIVTLSLPRGTLVLVVEVDLSTEGVTVFNLKVTATVELWRRGAPCWGAAPGTWRPVVFVPDGTRARALARGIHQAGGGELWLVSELGLLRERGAFGHV